MQKTKFGVSVGIIGALLYFCGLYGGYLITILLTGYVLLMEDNLWLKKTAVKAAVLMVVFSALQLVVGVIPQAISIVNSVFSLFGSYFSIGVVEKIISLFRNVVSFAETVVFAILGLKALSQGTLHIPIVDGFINKHIDF